MTVAVVVGEAPVWVDDEPDDDVSQPFARGTDSGDRLARLLGLGREQPGDVVVCTNLLDVPVDAEGLVGRRADEMLAGCERLLDEWGTADRWLLCGRRVEWAFRTVSGDPLDRATRDFFVQRGGMMTVPHPSGRNRFWNEATDEQWSGWRATVRRHLGPRYRVELDGHVVASGWELPAMRERLVERGLGDREVVVVERKLATTEQHEPCVASELGRRYTRYENYRCGSATIYGHRCSREDGHAGRHWHALSEMTWSAGEEATRRRPARRTTFRPLAAELIVCDGTFDDCAPCRGSMDACDSPHGGGYSCQRTRGHNGPHQAHRFHGLRRGGYVEWVSDGEVCSDDHRTCVDEDDVCGNRDSRTSYYYLCSRERGHAGDHIACGGSTHNIARWSAAAACVADCLCCLGT